jgi:hypothetical protein
LNEGLFRRNAVYESMKYEVPPAVRADDQRGRDRSREAGDENPDAAHACSECAIAAPPGEPAFRVIAIPPT